MTDYQEKLNEARANNRNLFGALGETGKGFNIMHDAAVKDGALDLKTKRLQLRLPCAVRDVSSNMPKRA